MVDFEFKENEHFSDELAVNYLASLVTKGVLEPFLIEYKKFENRIHNIISNSSNREIIEKVKAIIAYIDVVNIKISREVRI